MNISRFETPKKPTETQRAIAYMYWEKVLGRRMCYICSRRDMNGHKKTGKNGVTGLELHHIKPRSFGGTNEYDNLLPLCHKCHKKVHEDIYKFVENVIFEMTNRGFARINGQLDSEVIRQIANYSQHFFSKIVDRVKQQKKELQVVEFSKFLMEPDSLL